MITSSHSSIEITSTTIGPFAMLLIVIVGVWLLLMWVTAMKNHHHSTKTTQRLCPGCSTPNPGHAGFCRSCGRKL
jgi:hypothetical protein